MIVERIGFEQILVDAQLTVEQVAEILEETGFIDLSMYWDDVYE